MEEDSRFLPVDPATATAVTPTPRTPRSPRPLRPQYSPSQSYSYSYSQSQFSLSPADTARDQYISREDIILENYIEKEYKKIIGCSVRKKQDSGWRRFVGLPLAVLSAICTGSVHVCISLLNETSTHKHNGEGDHGQYASAELRFDVQNILLWCFGTILVLAAPLLLFCMCLRRDRPSFHALCPCEGSCSCSWAEKTPQCTNWVLLLVSGALCWAAVILRFSSVHYLSTYETGALSYTEPLVIVILAHFFVSDEKCGLISILAALLTLAGSVTFAWSHISERDAWHRNLAYGIGLALGSVACHSVLTTFLRIIRSVHFTAILTWLGLCGFMCTLVSFTVHGQLAAPSDFELRDLLLLAAIGLSAFGSLLFFVVALKYEEAAVVSIVLSLEIVLAHLGEFLLWDDAPGFDVFRIIGESTLLCCLALVAVRKFVRTLPHSHESASRDHSHCCSTVRI